MDIPVGESRNLNSGRGVTSHTPSREKKDMIKCFFKAVHPPPTLARFESSARFPSLDASLSPKGPPLFS